MSILGYQTGPIASRAAFIADFDIDRSIPIEGMVSRMDSDRRTMAARPGMRSKYVPLRFDPATGAHQIGGRYLFESWGDMSEYMHFTSEELEFEQGVKFWDRSFFSNIDKHGWHVVGAHDLMPMADHYVSRFERFEYETKVTTQDLEAVWPVIRDAARDEGLAAIWLLVQPDRRQVALLTVAARLPDIEGADEASRSLTALEQRVSLSSYLPKQSAVQKRFDRTSVNLAIWLPRSDALGGDACLFPTYPVHPLPNSDA